MPVDPNYVFADTPHPSTFDPGAYGCIDREINATTRVQDGWTPDGRKHLVEIPIRRNSDECGHEDKRNDPKCGPCKWRHTGP